VRTSTRPVVGLLQTVAASCSGKEIDLTELLILTLAHSTAPKIQTKEVLYANISLQKYCGFDRFWLVKKGHYEKYRSRFSKRGWEGWKGK
jgi:hypothetical protein